MEGSWWTCFMKWKVEGDGDGACNCMFTKLNHSI